MRIVLDTNVLVSGLLSPYGPSASVVRLVASGALELLFDGRVLAEYKAVLARSKFSFPPASIELLLDQIQSQGIPVAGFPLPQPLPDEDDEVFLEVALAGDAEALVTGNQKHFPEELRCGIRVLSPREFADSLRDRQRV